ncbi:Zn-ribbon domain-containing OB-fold protein [Chloroflexota bacterium]
MGFEKFGVVSFTTDSKVSPFVDYLEKGKIMTTKCKQCGKVFFPPKADCPKCLSSDVEWLEVNTTGTLITYTIVNYGPAGFEDDSPYILGIAEFDKDLRILARISKAIDPSDIKVGMKIQIAPVKLANEHFIYEMK